jgi:MFS family permease
MKHTPAPRLGAVTYSRLTPGDEAVERIGHPGWLVVAGAFLVLMAGFGAMYSYAAFAEAIAAEFGSSRTSISLVFALSGGSCFMVSALAGPLADRIGARVLAAAGMLMVGTGLMVAATANTLIEVYVGYGLLTGLGVGFAYVPVMAEVQRWFTAHRGLASGLAISGSGVGTALVPAAADALALLGDWRAAFVAAGVLVVLVGLLGALLLRPLPRAGDDDAAAPKPPRVAPHAFLLAYGGALLVSLAATLPHALLVATARDLGLPLHDAVSLLGLIGVGTIPGRFLLAGLADVLGRRIVFLGCAFALSASMVVWAGATSLATLQVFALGFGAVHGGFAALLPAFVADGFGTRGIGRILGVLYTARGIALLAAPPTLAFGITAFAGHTIPLMAIAVAGCIGTVLLAAARR